MIELKGYVIYDCGFSKCYLVWYDQLFLNHLLGGNHGGCHVRIAKFLVVWDTWYQV